MLNFYENMHDTKKLESWIFSVTLGRQNHLLYDEFYKI